MVSRLIAAVFLGILPLLAASGASGQVWDLAVIHPAGNHGELAVDSAGRPHIIFTNCRTWEHCEPDGPRALTYGTRDAAGWRFELLAGDPAGFLTAITVDAGGAPHVAYCDSNWQRHYGMRTPAGWVMEDLDTLAPPYYRASPSLVLTAAGEPHLVNIEREHLHYARKVGGSWVDEAIPDSWLDNEFARAAIVIDSGGGIHVGSRQYYASAVLHTLGAGGWTADPLAGGYAYNPWMVLDGNDAAHFVYHGAHLYYATNAGGAWVEERVLEGTINEDDDIAVDAAGRPFILYARPRWTGFDPWRSDVDLLLTWREASGWVSETLVGFTGIEGLDAWQMSPRLEIDAHGVVHVMFRVPTTGELAYGTRAVPSAALVVPPAGRADAITGITPNPFNPGTAVSFRLDSGSTVELGVYDVSGRRVRRLVGTGLGAGDHSLAWDGRTDAGLQAPSGVYFFRLETARGADTRRGVLVK